ncbi:MAG: hypothetical protein V5A56_16335, partial [Halolamina sp.]
GRLGVETRLHAMIGEDRFGEAIQERFAAEPVEFRFDDDPNGTERHINLMNDNGERISIFVVPPTREPEINYERLEQWVATADALVVIVITVAIYRYDRTTACGRCGTDLQ